MEPAMLGVMDSKRIVAVLDAADDLTIATVRADGYPQATTVSFVNEGLNIYFGTGAQSQKTKNIALNDKVSVIVNLPYSKWMKSRASASPATRAASSRRMNSGASAN
jgi:nitroimidazol reductase NimA-like FMN-containing flavoprotein (pyridoxamine 5'-phosphate oxidase superfamily)